MSELINTNSRAVRNNLLTSVSAIALLGIVWTSDAVADDGHQVVWLELGGQLERVDSSQAVFSPPFFDKASTNVLAPMTEAQLPPHYSIGGEAKVSFTPEDSNWVLSAAIRYGRSNAIKHKHYETHHAIVPISRSGDVLTSGASTLDEFGDGQSESRASHFIVDFKAGKDVGLGMFGAHGSSVVSAGVRFAQFTSSADITLHARPIYHSLPPFHTGSFYLHSRYFQNNTAVLQSRRSTQAVGPALSWDASAPIAGSGPNASLSVDWGVNAAILFGRQRAHVHHQTDGDYFKGLLTVPKYKSNYANPPVDKTRSRIVTIPNIGGFAGATFRYANAKVSFGYRADFFLGAMDNGIDTAKKSNVGFYGPFASVSIGIGG